jgi:hypothetical protein
MKIANPQSETLVLDRVSIGHKHHLAE